MNEVTQNTVVEVGTIINVLGLSAPALSLIAGLGAVLLVRLMLLSKEPQTKASWWFYNVALTTLLMLAELVFVIDRKLGPGLSMLLGIGLGSSGIVLVDIAKRYLEVIVGATAKGQTKDDA